MSREVEFDIEDLIVTVSASISPGAADGSYHAQADGLAVFIRIEGKDVDITKCLPAEVLKRLEDQALETESV